MEQVAVAVSGGVDSSAALVLLHRAGVRVCAVAMHVRSETAACVGDARRIASMVGVPFYEFDAQESFRKLVVEPFVRAYQRGVTPNPCLDCNRRLKFSELRRFAREVFDTRELATGHYAQIRRRPNGEYALVTAKDASKDQSYFLYALTQDDLQRTRFPVGGMTKSEVRDLLSNCGLEIADKPESQDICFVSGAAADFVGREIERMGDVPKPGPFVDSAGRTLGMHDGIHRFTVGQRRGLGIGGDRRPLYVLAIDETVGRITVGEREELERSCFTVRDLNWISTADLGSELMVLAKLRYRHNGVGCKVTPLEDNCASVEFRGDWSAVSPGQAAVFYRLEAEADGAREVLGGGIIVR